MSMNSQLQRWNKRYGIKAGDDYALQQMKQHDPGNPQYEGTERLASEAGLNMKDVAMAVSYEALATYFPKMLSSTATEGMKELIPELRQMVRKTIQEELMGMLQGLQLGIQKFTENQDQSVPEIRQVQDEPKQFVGEMFINRAKHEAALTTTEFEIPRKLHRGGNHVIDWKACHGDIELEKRIIFAIMKQAEAQGMKLSSGLVFKNAGGDYNGVLQRALSIYANKGRWAGAVQEYNTRKVQGLL